MDTGNYYYCCFDIKRAWSNLNEVAESAEFIS